MPTAPGRLRGSLRSVRSAMPPGTGPIGPPFAPLSRSFRVFVELLRPFV